MNIMENFSTEELIELINNAYDLTKNSSSNNIDDFPKLKNFFEHGNFHSIDVMINGYLIPEANNRLYKVVPLVLKRYIGDYLREF